MANLSYAAYGKTIELLDLQAGHPFNDLTNICLTPELLRSVPEDIVRKHNVIPLQIADNTLTIALSNPEDLAILDDIRFFAGKKVKFIVAEEGRIKEIIQRYYPKSIDFIAKPREISSTGHDSAHNDDVIVGLVNAIISDAISMNASDVHFEPLETRLRVRYRIDDFCYEVNSFEKSLHSTIASRIKVMAGIDLAEKRLPQDGRIKMRQAGVDINIRVSTLPVVHGESIVLRILDKSNVRKGLKMLGLLEEDYNILSSLVKAPDGMIIVSGPTGSGKTTTLYAILHELMRPQVKIITIEDPVEYMLDGINQIQVNVDQGRDYSRILRHILRHDPNVIMVGEMRDLESVEIAMRSALTGHKVLSTLHTNDAPSVITRLINMGLPPFMINAAVQAVVYQRLVRTLCQRCKIPIEITNTEIQSCMKAGQKEEWYRNSKVENEASWFGPKGCRECNYSGYKGRTALFEVMPMDEEIKRLAMRGASSAAIRKVALERGMRDIKMDGMMKATKGITSISEVLRVI
ncbi:MAG: type II/IV secretion system protein [Candidatus Brocadia sp.]